MKKFLFICMLCVSVIASAQSNYQKQDTLRTSKERLWYLGVNGGAQVFSGMSDHNLAFGKRIAPVGGISFGRIMNNWLSLDATLTIAQFKGLYVRPTESKHFTTDRAFDLEKKTYYQDGAYLQFYVRAGFDLNTIIAGYKSDRKGSFEPYVGVGLSSGLGKSLGVCNLTAAPTLDYGLQYKYNFCKSCSGIIDFHGNAVSQKLEGESCDLHAMHASYGLKLGLIFNLD